MEPLCEYCGAQRALVYCESDSARLCLPCDLHVHAANALSRRHSRSLLCDLCAAGPAEAGVEGVSLCAACRWDGGGGDSVGTSPGSRYPVSCYSGCPTTGELSTILAAGRGNGGNDGNVMANVMGTMASIDENCPVIGEVDPTSSMWMGSGSGSGSAMPEQQHKNHANTSPTLGYPPFRDNNGICDDNGFCEGFDPGNLAYNMDNIELFGSTQPKYPYQDGGLDGYFMDKNFSVVDSSGHIDYAIEASSSLQPDDMNLPSSHSLHAVSNNPDQMFLNLQSNRNVSFGFPAGNVCPNMSLSLSNLTGESSVADYQDCGVSPMFLNGESPWDQNLEISRPQARNEAKMRYNEKKKSRLFGKQIRYASRKARADTRKRVKGRFVKAGEAYDYDPLVARSS